MEKRDNRNSNRNRKPYGENRNSERSSFRHDSRNDSFGERRHGDENSSEDSSNRKSKDLRTGSKNSRFKDTRNDSSSSNDRRNNSHSSRSEGRGERNSSRNDRGEKRFSKNDRNDRKFSSDRDNSKGRFSKDERGEKRFSKNDRDDRKFSSDRDNSKGRFSKDERGEKNFSKDERGEKRFSKNDRNDRRFSKDRDNSKGRFSKDERGGSKYPKNNRNDRRYSRAREEREERISRDDFEEGNFIKPETRDTSNIEKSVERNSQEDRGERNFSRENKGERSSTEKDFKTPLKSKYSKKKQLEHNILYGPEDGLVRINRYIANTGFCSRREADRIIAEGKVIINGKVNIEVGRKVSKEDVVSINGKVLEPENKIYILLNKPKDCVTTMDDPMGRRTVLDLIDDACDERVYPVGRLDRMTTGLLIFTNDGDLTKRLTHPSYERKKIYHVHLDNPLDVEDLNQLSLKGVDLDDGNIIPDTVSYVNQSDRRELGIEIHSGKNRVVRRIFEHIGHEVVKLDRVYFAGLTKKNLPRGKWRFLTQREINMLKNF